MSSITKCTIANGSRVYHTNLKFAGNDHHRDGREVTKPLCVCVVERRSPDSLVKLEKKKKKKKKNCLSHFYVMYILEYIAFIALMLSRSVLLTTVLL